MRLKGHSAETLRVARGSHPSDRVRAPARSRTAKAMESRRCWPTWIRRSFAGAAFAALGIGLNGLLTALIVPLLAKF